MKEYHISAKDLQLKWTNIEIKNSQKINKSKISQKENSAPNQATQKVTMTAAKITPEPVVEVDESTLRKENMIQDMGFELGESLK